MQREKTPSPALDALDATRRIRLLLWVRTFPNVHTALEGGLCVRETKWKALGWAADLYITYASSFLLV